MKKQLIILWFVTVILSGGTAYAESEDALALSHSYVRPFIGMGQTFISNGEAQTYGSAIGDDINRTKLNGGFGVQVLADVTNRLRLGVEASFIHFINEITDKNNHPLAPNNKEYCYHTVNTLALAEFKVTDEFSVQAGSGLATSIKPNNRFTGTTPYFMIAPTWQFKLSNNTSIPLMLRLSTLESGKGNYGTGDGFGSIVGLTVLSGITLQY